MSEYNVLVQSDMFNTAMIPKNMKKYRKYETDKKNRI